MGSRLLAYGLSFGLAWMLSLTVHAQERVPPPGGTLPPSPAPVAEAAPGHPAPPPGKPGPVELGASGVPRPPSVSGQVPAASPTPPAPGAPDRIVEEPLEAPAGPVAVPAEPGQPMSVELEATKVPQPQPLIERRNMEQLGIVILVLSLLGNLFQLYRQRLYGKTLCNGMVSAFNSVAWLLARCMGKTRELNAMEAGGQVPDRALLKEFREFSLNTEFTLRALHEQLVAVARNLKSRDKKWKTGQFGYTVEEVEKIRGAVVERPAGEW